MMGHLSHEQRSEYALGEASPAVREHLRECAACRADAERFQAAMGHFRHAVDTWSRQTAPAPRRRPAYFAAALAAGVLLVAAGVAWRVTPVEAPPAAAAAEEIEVPMERPVPRSMRPLTLLVAGTEFADLNPVRRRNEQ